MQSLNNIISLNQAAEISGYTQDYLGYLIRSGEMKGVKKGGVWFTTEEEIKNYILSQETSHKNHPQKPAVRDLLSHPWARNISVLTLVIFVGLSSVGFYFFGRYNHEQISVPTIVVKGFVVSVGSSLTNVSVGLADGWISFTEGILNNIKDSVTNTKEFASSVSDGAKLVSNGISNGISNRITSQRMAISAVGSSILNNTEKFFANTKKFVTTIGKKLQRDASKAPAILVVETPISARKVLAEKLKVFTPGEIISSDCSKEDVNCILKTSVKIKVAKIVVSTITTLEKAKTNTITTLRNAESKIVASFNNTKKLGSSLTASVIASQRMVTSAAGRSITSAGSSLTSVSTGLANGWISFTQGILDNIKDSITRTKEFAVSVYDGAKFVGNGIANSVTSIGIRIADGFASQRMVISAWGRSVSNLIASIPNSISSIWNSTKKFVIDFISQPPKVIVKSPIIIPPSLTTTAPTVKVEVPEPVSTPQQPTTSVAGRTIIQRIYEQPQTTIINQTDPTLFARIQGIELALLNSINHDSRQTDRTYDSISQSISSASNSITEEGTLNDTTLNSPIIDDAVITNFTATGQTIFTKVPTLAHAFVPSWPSDVSNVSDSTIYINPAESVADGNLLGLAVGGTVKFLVDAEGDVYAKNLILTGSTTAGSTTIGTLNVEGLTTLGDAPDDTVTVNGTVNSNIIFTDNSYDIGASGLTRPRTGYFGTSVVAPLFTGALTGNVTGNITGNADTATKLAATKTIGGVAFDGSADITVASATGGFAISGGALTLGTNDITDIGSIGATGTRITKGWFTDAEITNLPTINGGTLATALSLSSYLPLAGGTMTGGITNSTSSNPLTTLAESWIGPSSTAGIYFKGGNVGIGTTNPRTALEVAGNADGAILATGTYGSGWTEPNLGAGARMLWYPRKAAFRAGYVDGTTWDNANIGVYSTAMGYGTKASGSVSTAMGQYTTASNNNSIAMGFSTTASGVDSTAMGFSTTASGDYSTSIGQYTTASSSNSFAIGRYNIGGGTAQNWVATDPLFEIGIGTASNAKANAMTVLKNGNVGIGIASPTAILNIKAGSDIANGAPLKLTSGALTTGANITAGSIEFLTDAYYGTITTGAARKQFAFTSDLTSGYIPYTGGTSNVDLGIHNLTVDTNTLFVDSVNHRVGIGTTGPAMKLDVKVGTDIHAGFRPSTEIGGIAAGTALQFYTDAAAAYANGEIEASTLVLNLLSGGKVGIGLAAPGEKLSVAGNLMVGDANWSAGTTTGNVAIQGNVGIGTTAPLANLHVQGATSLPSITSQTGTFRIGTAATTGLNIGISPGTGGYAHGTWIQTTNELASGGGAFALMLNPLGGNVGIGTTDPAGYTLYVKATTPTIRITSAAETDALNQILVFGSPSINRSQIQSVNRTLGGGDLSLWTTPSDGGNSPQQRLTILANGNVGIGTTNPTGLLDIQEPNGVSGINMFRLRSKGNSNTDTGQMLFSYTNGSSAELNAAVINWGTTTGTDGYLSFHTATNGTNAVIERMRINSSGNVGIGTTTPGILYSTGASKLIDLTGTNPALVLHNSGDVLKEVQIHNHTSGLYIDSNGAATASNNGIHFRTTNTNSSNTSTEALTILSTGNVGIGIVGPRATLDIGKSTGVYGTLTQLIIQPPYHVGGPWKFDARDDATGANLDIHYGTATGMTLQSSGNVGIGTAAPGTKLDVNGSVRFSGSTNASPVDGELVYDLSAHAYKYYNNSTWLSLAGGTITSTGSFWAQNGTLLSYTAGNVGIGTTNPGVKLDINGGVFAQGGFRVTNAYNAGATIEFNAGSAGSVSTINTNYFDSPSDLALGTYAYPQLLYLKNNGNVGIGTTAPGYDSAGWGTDPKVLTITGGTNGNNFGVLQMARGTNVDDDVVGILDFVNANNTGAAGTGRYTIAEIRGMVDTATSNASGNSGGHLIFFTKADAGNPAERMRITSSGNVGIGTTGPGTALQITSSEYTQLSLQQTGAYTARTFFAHQDVVSGINSIWAINRRPVDGVFDNIARPSAAINMFAASGESHIGFFTSPTNNNAGAERMRIDKDGNVGIGTTSPGNILTIQQTSATDPIADAWTVYSSGRWKENRVPMINALETINKLNPIYFDWKAEYGGAHDLGFIAEEVGLIIPEVVAWEANGLDAKSIDYARLSTIAIAGIKELNLKVADMSSLDTTSATSLGSLIKNFLADIANNVENLYASVIHSDKVETKMLCVGATCVTEQEFLEIVNKNVTTTPTPESEPVPDQAPADETSTCTDTQTLVDNVCVDNEAETPTCTDTQTLVDNVCVDNEAEVPTCTDTQTLVDNVCVNNEPADAESSGEATPEVPTCTENQTLVDNVCVAKT